MMLWGTDRLRFMSIVVRVLGPLEVSCTGRPVVIRGGNVRLLLVRLALQA